MSDTNDSFKSDLPSTKKLIDQFNIVNRKQFGQHFLLDSSLTDKIVELVPEASQNKPIIEIGPGPGILTRSLIDKGFCVHAIEKDKSFMDLLAYIAKHHKGHKLFIHNIDALKVSEYDITKPPFTIVSNLPYNISTALLLKWFNIHKDIDSMVLIFQKEVAQRIIANPGSKAYGRLSIISQWCWDIESGFDINPQAFYPPPKVTSTVLKFTRKTDYIKCDTDILQKITAMAFGQRRKMLRSSLRDLNIDLDSIGISPTLRAENLSIQDFCNIANFYENLIRNEVI